MQQEKDGPTIAYTVTGTDPVTVAIRGEVDVATAPEVFTLLEDLMLFNRNLVLDLGAVEFMDSSGLHVFVKVRTALQEIGGSLEVASASHRVRRLFELSGVDQLLPLPSATDTAGGVSI